VVRVAEPRLARYNCVICFGGDIVDLRGSSCGCDWVGDADKGEDVGVGSCCGDLKNVDIDF